MLLRPQRRRLSKISGTKCKVVGDDEEQRAADGRVIAEVGASETKSNEEEQIGGVSIEDLPRYQVDCGGGKFSDDLARAWPGFPIIFHLTLGRCGYLGCHLRRSPLCATCHQAT